MSEGFKISLGVELDSNAESSLNNDIKALKVDSIKLKLDDNDANTKLNNIRQQINSIQTNSFQLRMDDQRVLDQLDNIRQQILALGNITINFGGGNRSIGNTTTALNRANREVANLYKQIRDMEMKFDKLRMSGVDSGNITQYEQQINRLRTTYQTLLNTLGSQNINLDSVFSQLDTSRTEIATLSRDIENVRTKLAADIKLDIQSGDLLGQINAVEQKFNNLNITNDNVTNGITELRRLLGTMDASNDIESVTNDYQNFKQVLSTVTNQVDDLNRKQQSENQANTLEDDKTAFRSKIAVWLKNNSAAAKQFGERIEILKSRIDSCDKTQLKRLQAEFEELKREVYLADKATKTFGDKLKDKFKEHGVYLTASMVFTYATQALREMYDNIVEIDSAMTDLMKVTEETDAVYQNFLDGAGKKAQELGRSVSSFVQQTANWAKMGYSIDESAQLASVSSIYSNVADVDDATAVSDIVTAMKAFNIEAENAISIIDPMNKLSNEFAVTAAGLGQGLSRAASTMSTAGTGLESTLALLTGISEITQSPEEAGNFLKVSVARLQGMKGTLEELGEEVDESVDSISKVQTQILNLTHGKVNIFDDSGEFRDYYDVMNDIAKVVDDLTSTDRATLYEILFGKNRMNQGAAMIQAFQSGQINKALDAASNSAGSAAAEQEKWMESLEAKLGSLEAAFQRLSQTVINSDLLKGVIDVLTGVVNFLDWIIDNLGVINTALIGIGAFKGFKNILSVSKAVGGLSSLSDILSLLSIAFPNVAKGINVFTKSLKAANFMSIGGNAGLTGLAKAATVAKGAVSGLFTVLKAHPIIAVATALLSLVTISQKVEQAKEELSQEVDELTSKYEEQQKSLQDTKDKLNELTPRYEELSKGVSSLGKNVSLTASEYSEYLDITNQLAEMFPDLVQGHDAEGNAILTVKGNVDSLIDSYKELQNTSNQSILTEGKKIFKEFKNSKNDFEKIGFWGTNYTKKDNDALKELLYSSDIDKTLEKFSSESYNYVAGLSGKLRDAGIEQKAGETARDFIKNAVKDHPQIVKEIVKSFEDEMEDATDGLYTLSTAYVNSELSSEDYSNISDSTKSIINSIISQFDYDFYSQFDSVDELYDELDDILEKFNTLSDKGKNKIETYFDLQTKLNNGDCTVGEYLLGISELKEFIETLDEDDQKYFNYIFNIDTNSGDIEKKVADIKKQFSESDGVQISGESAKEELKNFNKWIDGLTAEELQIAYQIYLEKDTAQYSFLEWKNAVERYSEDVIKTAQKTARTLAEINEEKSGLSSIFETYKENEGKLSQEEVSSMLEENPEYIYYLTKVGEHYKLNQEALDKWNETNEEQKDYIDNMMGENTYLENYDKLLDDIKKGSSHSVKGGVGDTGLEVDELDDLIDKNKELNKSLLDGKISVTDYFNSISNSITESGLEEALESLNGKFDETTDYIEETVSVLATELSDAMLQANKRFLKGETSVKDYIAEMRAGMSAQQKLLKSTYGLTVGTDGFVDEIEDADVATQNAVKGYNDLTKAQQELDGVSGFVGVLSDNAVFLDKYTDTAGNLMESIFDDSRLKTYVNSLSTQLYNFALKNEDNMRSVSKAIAEHTGLSMHEVVSAMNKGSTGISGIIGDSLTGIQGLTEFAMSNVEGSITNSSSAIGAVMTSLGDLISNFEYNISATPYIKGLPKFSIDSENGFELQFPSFGYDITGNGGESVAKFAEALKESGNYFTNTGAEQASSKALDINSYLPSGEGDGSKSVDPSELPDTKSKKSKSKSKKTFDWIEVAIERVKKAFSKLDSTVNNTYKTWTTRNNALTEQINTVGDEIDLQNKAYDKYMQKANSVGLSEEWAELVRDGAIDIDTIDTSTDSGEKLADKISEYQTWYNKALDCKDAILELQQTESELYKQAFDNVAAEYENYLSVIEHEKSMLDAYIAQSEAKGHIVSTEYYNALIKNEQSNIAKLQEEKQALLFSLQTAMKSGTIEKGSEAWYDMCNQIDSVTLAIEEANTAIIEYGNSIREIEWEVFDLIQEQISQIAEESNFLIDLMSNDKLYDDKGQLTDEGMATMGLHGLNHNTYMAQSEEYAKEILDIDKELADDPYNQKLLERRQELLDLQRESILAAEDEKQAIIDMVREGIELELNSLQELIDSYTEALDSQKDLYDYQRKVAEQTKEIASLEKQMSAYSGDTSEETKAKIQQLKVDLETARENLEETEYERYISDQEKLLDDLYLEYETVLNERLDNVDGLLSDMITEINNNAATISETLSTEAENVGYIISDTMKSIWDNGSGSENMKDVLAGINGSILNSASTIASAIGTMKSNYESMIAKLKAEALAAAQVAQGSSVGDIPVVNTVNPPADTPADPPDDDDDDDDDKSLVGKTINVAGAQIYDYAGDESGERQYFRNNPNYTVLAEKDGYVKVRQEDLDSGVTGWFKIDDIKSIKGHKAGKRNFLSDEIAWTQENGREMIIRPSDGAILTPLARGDSVLNSVASGNIWNMANNPSEFIRDNLKLGDVDASIGNNGQANYTQYLDKVVFNLPNVKNYNELLSEMQSDKNFERLILSMTVDRLAGKSSLAKGKSIR